MKIKNEISSRGSKNGVQECSKCSIECVWCQLITPSLPIRPFRFALCDPETHGGPIQHLLRVRSHQTQPAHPPSRHPPGGPGAHPLHSVAALLLRPQIRYLVHLFSVQQPPESDAYDACTDTVPGRCLSGHRPSSPHHPLHLRLPTLLCCRFAFLHVP